MRNEARSLLSGGRSGQRRKVWVGIILAGALPVALALPGITSSILPGVAPVSAASTSPGSLRVVSSPAVPTQILVDGQIADSWGLTWLSLAPGTHTVSFTDVPGYTTPAPQTVTVTSGATTTVTGTFVLDGYLRVMTSPAVPSQITVDGNPGDDSGLWTDLPTGSHKVCFGAVIGYDPPPCQTATLTAGNTTTITGTFTADSSATGQAGMGLLRVTTNPAVPSQITLTPQGGTPTIADSWSLNWLQLTPGTYTVSFSHVPGYTEPAPQTVTITAGATSTVTGTFATRGTLRVTTSPAVDATVSIDSIPADNWGVWTDLPTGTHQICFGALTNYTTPPCQTATITAGNETDITGTYTATTTPPAACVFASSPGATPAFCDSFSAPDATGNRAGQLDGTVWGASRVSGNENIGAPADGWPSAQLSSCGSTALVNPPNDIQICNGQLVDTLNDGGTVASLAMYPKQPFDFAGRTGTITFDVSNDSQGNHEAWPELWVTDQPVPDPFGHEASWMAYPRNGFGIRFAGCTDSTGAPNTCTLGQNSVGVDSAIIIKNYAGNDSFSGGSLKVIGLGSVLKSGAGQVNHYEVQVSTNEIDIYATNPFTGTLNLANTPLVHIATIPNASLSFTRGLVWIEDVHYNGDKFGTQRLHSFFWENVGFDGPVLPRDLAFDVPDNTTPDPNINFTGIPGTDLGYYVAPNSSLNLTDPGVTGIAQASGGLLTFNFWELATPPITLTVAVNGNTISVPWAYPDDTAGSPRTLAVPIPLTDIQTGNNTITFTTGNYGLNVMNTDLILQGAGGTVNP